MIDYLPDPQIVIDLTSRYVAKQFRNTSATGIDDMIGESLLTIYRRRLDYKPWLVDFRTWIWQRVADTLRVYFKRRRKEADAMKLHRPERFLFERFDFLEARDTLAHVLPHLERRHRAILCLHCVLGLRWKDVAERIGVSPGRIRQLVQQAQAVAARLN